MIENKEIENLTRQELIKFIRYLIDNKYMGDPEFAQRQIDNLTDDDKYINHDISFIFSDTFEIRITFYKSDNESDMPFVSTISMIKKEIYIGYIRDGKLSELDV